jgi:two-component system LytT family response regulator
MTADNKSNLVTDNIRTIIVEDEQRSQATLIKLLEECCPSVHIVSVASNVAEAIAAIDEYKPEMVFLDIALPDGDGFNVLESTSFENFEVVFVTAYDKYAIRAFEFSALHYLLKPINQLELQNAVQRFQKRKDVDDSKFNEQLQILKENINNDQQKLMLPTFQGYDIISLEDVIRFEASHNYTECYLVNDQKIIISKPLINFENILSDLYFVRVHNKHLINLRHVKKYVKGQGGSLRMIDNSEINVSKSRKNEFLDKLNNFARHI